MIPFGSRHPPEAFRSGSSRASIESSSRRKIDWRARSWSAGSKRCRKTRGPGGGSSATYHDRATMAVFANLGLSTQLAVLGMCLVLDVPEVYLWLVLGSLVLLPLLVWRRERLARRALSEPRAA